MQQFKALRKSDYWIGDDIKILASRNLIKRGGKEIKIQPRLMSVLTALASNSQKVVSREALIEMVWKDFYTGDLALNQSISKLRKALGDTSDESRIIETVIKNGYRLLLPVHTNRPPISGIKSLVLPSNAIRYTLSVLLFGVVVYFSIQRRYVTEPLIITQDPNGLLTDELNAKIQELSKNPESYNQVIKELKQVFPDSVFEINKDGKQSVMIYHK